ncbi:MAG: hypothetical protein ACREQ5_25330 [Candidatus Dormibacteria bacterium]
MLSIAVVAGLQAGALYLIPHIAAAFVWLADVVLRASDVRVVVDNVDFLGSALPTAVVDVPPPRTSELVLCITFGIAAIFGARFKQRSNPIRYLIVFAALVFIASAIELLLMGRPAYESLDFSAIWLRTSLIIWSLGPTLLGLASMLFPFHVRERVALIVSALIFDSIFSIARYVVVLAGISTAGPIVFPLALTLCGPVLDAFLYVALFSRALVGLSLRLSRSPELWRWSLR